MTVRAALVAAAVACACAPPAAARLKMELLDQMQPGVTTVDDAIAAFGKPQSVTTNDEGRQLLQWIRVNVTGAKHFSIVFDEHGKMVRVHHRFKK